MNRTKLYSAVAAGLLVSTGYSAQSQAQSCVLEVAKGATIVGATNEDFLVIEQGCQIRAEGTAEQPINFTADKAVTGEVENNERGLWGGLVINGFAPINDCPEGVAGGTAECTKEGEANSGLFGGDDPADNSGILKYVVVSYAGSNVDPENQLNGIAFQGVGSGTEVDYVQVHNNLDDGIEFFGGTVSASHVVLTGNADDSLDWTDGWQGSIQYLYMEQKDSGDNLIEADNREGDENAEPRSLPDITNMSAYGLGGENGLRFRRGTGIHLTNSFVVDSGTCLRIGGESRNLLGTDLTIGGTSFGCAETHRDDDDGAVEAYLDTAEEVSQTGGQVNPVTPSGDFESAPFIGAFGGDDWTAGWTVAGSVSNGGGDLPSTGCPAGTTEGGDINGTPSCILPQSITSDLTLSSGNFYVLDGKVVVGGDNADSATLTVNAGVTIVGDDAEDFLVISRGSQIVANGTANAPITLTGLADVDGTGVSDATRGLWGGLVINGNAPINDCPEGAVGGTDECTKEGEANSGLFGGSDASDSSGSLKYVVVKYAGSNVDPENQLNGIAFQGVGSGTMVDYVQVHNNLDDGIEFFGGTVSAKHLVLTGNADDSLDWTDGWQGNIQYLVINQAADSADNGIEADNREGDENAMPRSAPMIANMSIVGNPGERGVRFRRGTGIRMYNTYITDNATCIDVDGDTSNGLLGTEILFDGVSFNCPEVVDGDNPELQSYLDSLGNVSQTGGSVMPVDLAGMGDFETVDFIGAADPANDWTAGWAFGDIDLGSPDFPAEPAGCPDGITEGDDINGTPSCLLPQSIIADMQLTMGNYYVLDGKVTVGGDNTDSATLTIDAGVTIVGDDAEDFLVISRGSRIVANGTATAPVTLTGLADVDGSGVAPVTRGLWGGLVINGNAPINDCPEGAQGGTVECTKEGEANSGLFGGADAADSSGSLNYVVVKYAGSNVDPENQLNGIAFQGVGSGTMVDFIQVHNNLDDGIEFFGGTVDAKHVVLSGNADDSLDWTDGWQGRLQYVHIVQADDSADNGIEADNREGDENAEPRSNPTIANMSIMGNSGERGIRLRRGTGADLYNVMVSGNATCIDVDGDTSIGLIGMDINIESASFGCPEVVDGDNADLQIYLDGAVNVTQDGSIPTAATLPSDGFFESSDVVGSDFDSWKGSWVFGL
ncbi:hypothetical protein BST95_04170 [Halioglobus japonicus]|uniref:Uncharacterized protein n=1 Tax=Halioglobus japonicus TaxID=930805 RepID=A0AAP8SMF5_9GAMM|nr:hypothetical protein [Halioglobus japonicus]AQA17546.1 hypothetical protein BST95_04170 [Halioglobus japonicus]PLW85484.1 hypothetical protein C0029_12735 [Halioglobus japonicus]GHD15877.1 hypothetical protein GCM10007052_20640 [Halioglobus japonicus]